MKQINNKLVFVYKTDISRDFKVSKLQTQLDKILGKHNWTIDFDDFDSTLKISSDNLQNVIHSLRIIKGSGIQCRALNTSLEVH